MTLSWAHKQFATQVNYSIYIILYIYVIYYYGILGQQYENILERNSMHILATMSDILYSHCKGVWLQ